MVAAALLIGFLIGTRARQVLASAKVIGKAVRSFTIKIPAVADDGDKGDDGDDDVENEEFKANHFSVDDYLNMEQSGLDDHPDMQINPVLMYQIKLERERQREEKRRADKLALLGDIDGLSPDEVEQRLAATEFEDNAGPAQKANALATLISVGARVTAVHGGGSAESALIAERRRLQRNIDVYLQRALDIDVKRSAPTKRVARGGGALPSAAEVARETGLKPFGGENHARSVRNLRIAKDSRNVWRSWEARRRLTLPPELIFKDEPSDGEEETDKQSLKRRAAAGGGAGLQALDADALGELEALLEYDIGDEFGEEDGEEGADLAA